MKKRQAILFSASAAFLLTAISVSGMKNDKQSSFLGNAEDNAKAMIDQGRQIFRFDTYGDEAYWTGQLQIQQSVKSLTPRTALALGLKVDAQALSPSLVNAIQHGQVNLDDPAVTLQLIQQNAVLGVVGTFNNNTLTKVGFTCALCHSTVDDSVAPGLGTRIDGLGNRDLNVGANGAWLESAHGRRDEDR